MGVGTKYLGLMICAALFILVMGEATEPPASEATEALPSEAIGLLASETFGLLASEAIKPPASEAIGLPASEATKAPEETTTQLNLDILGLTTPVCCGGGGRCYWNVRRHLATGIPCWYKHGFGRGPCR